MLGDFPIQNEVPGSMSVAWWIQLNRRAIDFNLDGIPLEQRNFGPFLGYKHVHQTISEVDFEPEACPSFGKLSVETGHSIPDLEPSKALNYRQPRSSH